MQTAFALARTITALIFMVYSSWSDYKTREVENIVWAFFAPLAFGLTITELFLYESAQLPFYGLCFGLTATFAILLFYAGGFGGADAKALMCLALALPFYPENEFFRPVFGTVSPISKVFFPLTIFSNATILVILPISWIILRNLLWRHKSGRNFFEGTQKNNPIGKKILVFITGCKMPIDRLKEKWHIYPLEDIEETKEGKLERRLFILPKDESRTAVVSRLENAVKQGTIENGVWASPGLPMLVLVTLGLVFALFIGDIVWTVITFLLR